jgi:Aspartyl protease
MGGSLVRSVCTAFVMYFAVAVAVVSAREPGTAPRPPEARTAPLVIEMDGGIVVMVRIEDAGPFRFRLDTGASRSVFSNELVARLGLARSGSSIVITPAGRAVRPLTTVGTVTAGCISAVGLRVAVVPAVDLDPGGQVDGLIGQDLLFDQVYTLDYQRALLSCQPPDSVSTRAVRLPLTVTDGRALVSLPQPRGALSLVPDSGADRLVLFTRAGRSPNALITPRETVRARSITGLRVARRVLVQQLQIGEARLGDHDGVLVDAPENDGMGDGLLPLHWFASVTFNGPAGYVSIEPRR